MQKSKSSDKSVLKTKADSIKEKNYLTKHVETSITILDSPEDAVVLEALLFLSKYADLKENNLTYLVEHGLIPKLLKLVSRNICILRVSLRLLSILLSKYDAVFELDQDKYNEDVMEISNMFIKHEDQYVHEFSVDILSKLAAICRISMMIFNVNLFNRIFEIIKTTTKTSYLQSTLQLLYVLISAPGALSLIPECEKFKPIIFLDHLKHSEPNISTKILEIIRKMTYYSIDAIQAILKEAHIMERMFELLMNAERKDIHKKVTSILINCMDSEESSSYFIESLEFQQFCEWSKTCDSEYLSLCAIIFEKLTKIAQLRHTLFELSVEDSILYLLRSTDKTILNKTCQAISNMTTHKYCCERMLTLAVFKELKGMLQRNDPNEDPYNEVALKTIHQFNRRNKKTLKLLFENNCHEIFIHYLKTGIKTLTEESFFMVLEILNNFVAVPEYQKKFATNKFFEEIIKLFQNPRQEIAVVALEMMTNCISLEKFRDVFLAKNGPSIMLAKLQAAQYSRLFKNILVFIHNIIVYDRMTNVFLRQHILLIFKEIPDFIAVTAPLIEKITRVIYGLCLPVKFFETNKLEFVDILKNKFYIINGPWNKTFPFLEILEMQHVSTLYSIYVVNYNGETDQQRRSSFTSAILRSKSNLSKISIGCFIENCSINYGTLSTDPFLRKYISRMQKCFICDICLSHKIKLLAQFVDSILCGPKEESIPQKIHTFRFHLQTLKTKLGTNMIPIGYLRIGFHCEKALLFKAIGDRVGIPAALVKGRNRIYWNEVALLENGDAKTGELKRYIVDLMNNIGNFLPLGSREANYYCNTEIDGVNKI